MLIKAGNLSINPAFVQSMNWDRTFYANTPGDATLVIHMADGTVHRVKHEGKYLDGADAYELERRITDAHTSAMRETTK